MSLPALLTASHWRDDTLTATIGVDWLQGRTAFGGASAVVALAAVKRALPGLPPLRSFQIAFVGPIAGSVTARPALLRRGRNSAFVACDVAGDDGIGLRALFLFMAPRASAIDHADLPAPSCPPPPTEVTPGPAPLAFIANFDLVDAAPEPTGFLRWVRLRDRTALDPELELVAIADALPPAAFALAPAFGPISTTTWQVNLVTATPATDDGWWLAQTRTLHAASGASSQSMTIWSRDGTPQATATQSVALFM